MCGCGHSSKPLIGAPSRIPPQGSGKEYVWGPACLHGRSLSTRLLYSFTRCRTQLRQRHADHCHTNAHVHLPAPNGFQRRSCTSTGRCLPIFHDLQQRFKDFPLNCSMHEVFRHIERACLHLPARILCMNTSARWP